jgi:hypothetical protein
MMPKNFRARAMIAFPVPRAATLQGLQASKFQPLCLSKMVGSCTASYGGASVTGLTNLNIEVFSLNHISSP